MLLFCYKGLSDLALHTDRHSNSSTIACLATRMSSGIWIEILRTLHVQINHPLSLPIDRQASGLRFITTEQPKDITEHSKENMHTTCSSQPGILTN